MNIDRALASVRKVKSLSPIEGADLIELAMIDDWQCVVGKGIHKEGDLVIYFEIDSFINGEDKRFESFSERFSNFDGMTGLRVKTIRLRKQLSQGIVMPVREFPEIKKPSEGLDVTKLLKVVQWEEAEKTDTSGSACKSAAVFPSFIPKTNQPRAQNIGASLIRSMDRGELFERTIKQDGSSMTVYLVRPDSKYFPAALKLKLNQEKRTGIAGLLQKVKVWYDLKFTDKYNKSISAVCSRNSQLKDHDGSNFWNVAISHQLVEILNAIDGSNALQGELLAPNIQSNFEKVEAPEFRLFDMFNIDTQQYYLPTERKATADQFSIPHVPTDAILTLAEVPGSQDGLVKALLAAAEGPGMNPNVKREGHVYKSMTNLNNSFKVVATSYLEAKEKKEKRK